MESISINQQLLLVTAAIAMLISLAEAWICTLIIYAKVKFLKRWFPSTQNLIRSHIDYMMMVLLLGLSYFIIEHLKLEIPNFIIGLTCLGALYNPFGFLLKAINPSIGNSDTLLSKIMICLSFLPTTLGFGYIMVMVLTRLLG